jgi:hypothetical protein
MATIRKLMLVELYRCMIETKAQKLEKSIGRGDMIDVQVDYLRLPFL